MESGWERRLGAVAAAFACLLFCGLTHADESPVMRAVILPELIPTVAQQLVPMTVELPPDRTDLRAPRFKIVGLAYCGADGRGGAYALGAVYPDKAAPASNTLTAADCETTLSDVAGRLNRSPGAPDWVEVMKTHVTWTPWRLSFAVADAAGAAKNGGRAPSLKDIGEFKTYPTSNLQILPPPGQDNRFDAAVGFSGSSMVLALFRSGRSSHPEYYLANDPSLHKKISALPTRANVLAEAQHAFINDLLRLYAPSYEIPIQLQGATQTLLARNIRVSGGDNTMTAAGQFQLGNIAYDGTVRCAGEDLSVREIALKPPMLNCEMSDIVGRLQCQGQQATMSGTSDALAAGLTSYYQGQRFHYSAIDPPLRFTIGGAHFAATFEALKSSSNDSTASEVGRASIHRVGQTASGMP